MIRRLLFVGALAYVVMAMSKGAAQRAAAQQEDVEAEANWDSEGGTPAPQAVDTATI